LLSIVLTSALASPVPAACPPGTVGFDGRCVRYGSGDQFGCPPGMVRLGMGPNSTCIQGPTRGTRDDKPRNVPPLTTTTTSSGDKVSQPKDSAVLRDMRVCPPNTYRTSAGCMPLSARPRN